MGHHRSRLRNRLELTAYQAARALVHGLGAAGVARVGSLIGAAYSLLGRSRREILAFNLGLAFPGATAEERRRLGRAVASHFGRMSLDTLRLQRLDAERLLDATTVEGRQHLDAALERGRGVILVTAHLGCWEVAALVTGMLIPGGLVVINRPLDNALLEGELQAIRCRFGNRTLGKQGVMGEMVRHLGAGGGVGLLIDQRTLNGQGVEVPFFGRPARTHPVVARLVTRTGAPVVPVWGSWRAPGRYGVRFDGPIIREDLAPGECDDVSLTAMLTARIEDEIRARPEQWLWYHDRWRQLRVGDGTG